MRTRTSASSCGGPALTGRLIRAARARTVPRGTGDETDVLPTSSVRIQFSRDMDPSTFRNRIKVRYDGDGSTPVTFTTSYLPGTRVLEIKLSAPLQRFSPVVVELEEGILGSDKQPLAPWSLKFQTGG